MNRVEQFEEPETRRPIADTIVELARAAAEGMIAAALADVVRTLGVPREAMGLPIVTVHPQTSAPRLLGDGKPQKRKYVKRAKRAKRAKGKRPKPGSVAAQREAVNAPGDAQRELHASRYGRYGSTSLRERKCRSCQRAGTASRVPNTAKTVKCSACGHMWDVRGLSDDAPAPATKQTKACRSCAHDSKHHIEMVGMCSVRGCACESFK